MVFVVGIGGVIGAILRYLIGLALAPTAPGAFPLGTFLANMIGSFMLAWLTAKAARSRHIPQWVVTGIGTGVIGSFTTFSTFSIETTHLLKGNYDIMAVIYVGVSLLAGWMMSFLGYSFGRKAVTGQ